MIEISPVTLTHSVTGFAIGNLPLSCSPAIVLDDATADATQSAASERHTVSSQIGRNSARFRSASPPSANAQYREDSGRADRCRRGSAARSRGSSSWLNTQPLLYSFSEITIGFFDVPFQKKPRDANNA